MKRHYKMARATLITLMLNALVLFMINWTMRSILIGQTALMHHRVIAQARSCAEGALRVSKAICQENSSEIVSEIISRGEPLYLSLSEPMVKELTKQIPQGRIMLEVSHYPIRKAHLSLLVRVYSQDMLLFETASDCYMG